MSHTERSQLRSGFIEALKTIGVIRTATPAESSGADAIKSPHQPNVLDLFADALREAFRLDR